MKPYHKNPRRLTEKQHADLKNWLRELGDLSGIVHDLNSGEIIGGNMRSRVFDVDKCEIELVAKLEQPDEQGTVAHGFIFWEGNRYAYREVRWTPKQCEKANIVANKAGGEWDYDVLANAFDVADLVEFGFDEAELGVFAVDGADNPALKDGDRAPFRQCTFTLHDEQFEEVEAAMRAAKAQGGGESAVNENSNGNALAWICQAFNRSAANG